MSDLEELADEARAEKRNQPSRKYKWEYVHGSFYQVPVLEDDLADEDDEIPTGN